MIETNLLQVQKRIQEACRRAGRNPAEVTLIAVSKTQPLSKLMEAYEAGVRDFGENKVQEILAKAPVMPEDARFHMIGHLQRNKVRPTLKHAGLIHAVDSVRLAEQIQADAKRGQLCVDILLEVNVAGEESKYGFAPAEIPDAVQQISCFPNTRICGLMTIAPFVENSEENRPIFRNLQQLSVDIKGKNIDNVSMGVLSMGMTGDFEVAIEEGATMIRVGTGIFGTR